MGFEEHKGSYYLPLYNSGDWVSDVELDYHTSWDWLMPVVKRIVSDVEFIVGYEDEEYREHLTAADAGDHGRLRGSNTMPDGEVMLLMLVKSVCVTTPS